MSARYGKHVAAYGANVFAGWALYKHGVLNYKPRTKCPVAAQVIGLWRFGNRRALLKVVTTTQDNRSLLLVWMRSRLHG